MQVGLPPCYLATLLLDLLLGQFIICPLITCCWFVIIIIIMIIIKIVTKKNA